MPGVLRVNRPLLQVEEAQARLLALARPVARQDLGLAAAAGRWVADDVHARRAQPGADLSAMDGYALRFADMPGPWQVVGESAAGSPLGRTLAAGQAARIFTGATMPAGADTVLVQEEAARNGKLLQLAGEGPPARGAHVRAMAQDFAQGALLMAKGTRLNAARVALAAAAGHAALPVNRLIRIAIIATGNELQPPGAPLLPGQLPESNGVMLAALLVDMPVEIVDMGIIADELPALVAAFQEVEADIIVTTGGASVGEHDLVRPALEAAGGALDFWRIALRPGKPLLAGTLGTAVVLGLPGNPVSAFVTAQLFLRPLIAAFGGADAPLPRTRHARLGAPLAANDRRQNYLRGFWRDEHVMAAAAQDSAMLLTLANADCLIIRPPHAPPAALGEFVQILDLA